MRNHVVAKGEVALNLVAVGAECVYLEGPNTRSVVLSEVSAPWNAKLTHGPIAKLLDGWSPVIQFLDILNLHKEVDG